MTALPDDISQEAERVLSEIHRAVSFESATNTLANALLAERQKTATRIAAMLYNIGSEGPTMAELIEREFLAPPQDVKR